MTFLAVFVILFIILAAAFVLLLLQHRQALSDLRFQRRLAEYYQCGWELERKEHKKWEARACGRTA